jgi:D-serine deaminase-like pyridoxal phosphate-dependent protein
VEQGTRAAIAALDASFFMVRFDRLTTSEKRYIRAMAELGAGPHRSGDIATVLGRIVSNLAPTRAGLIRKGMVWSPAHGETAFTVPLFHQFMKRVMPGADWKTE